MRRRFHLSDILSITHDRLFSTRHMEGIYDICNFLTGDNLFTHQLPRVHDECKAWLLTLHPQLATLELVSDKEAERLEAVYGKHWPTAWLREPIATFGEYLDVEPLPKGIHEFKDPIAEAEELVGRNRVIVVSKDSE